MTAPTLSIVLGTRNRVNFLRRALASIPPACGNLSYEVVIVDGNSTDGTLDFLRTLSRRKEFTIISQEPRGAVAAFMEGFENARGEYVAAFNDDAEYCCTAHVTLGVKTEITRPLENAVKLLQSDKRIGQIAIPFYTVAVSRAEDIPPTLNGTPKIAVVNLPVLGQVPYANFSVISRKLGEECGWWGMETKGANAGKPFYFQYAGDTNLSASVWSRGLRVVGLDPSLGYLVHFEAVDSTRVPNVETAQFNARWRGAKSPLYNNKKVLALAQEMGARDPFKQSGVNESPTLWVRYLGKKHGAVVYENPKTRNKYDVSAARPEFEIKRVDEAFMLSQKERGRRMFERVGQ